MTGKFLGRAVYGLIAAACLLSPPAPAQDAFRFPGMTFVPILATAVVIWILSHATIREYRINGLVLAAASVLFWIGAALRKVNLPEKGSR